MRMKATVVPVLICLVALAGCAAPQSPVTLPPSPSSTPVFASEDEALAAAEEAYGAYLAMSDLIASEGGADAQRIENVAAGKLADTELQGFADFLSQGLTSVGSSRLNNLVSQEVDLGGSPIVIAYVCVDVSGVDVFDNSGVSVVSNDRPDLQQFEVEFDDPLGQLLPVNREVWVGGGVCI
jgi:hypothetical protein